MRASPRSYFDGLSTSGTTTPGKAGTRPAPTEEGEGTGHLTAPPRPLDSRFLGNGVGGAPAPARTSTGSARAAPPRRGGQARDLPLRRRGRVVCATGGEGGWRGCECVEVPACAGTTDAAPPLDSRLLGNNGGGKDGFLIGVGNGGRGWGVSVGDAGEGVGAGDVG